MVGLLVICSGGVTWIDGTRVCVETGGSAVTSGSVIDAVDWTVVVKPRSALGVIGDSFHSLLVPHVPAIALIDWAVMTIIDAHRWAHANFPRTSG